MNTSKYTKMYRSHPETNLLKKFRHKRKKKEVKLQITLQVPTTHKCQCIKKVK